MQKLLLWGPVLTASGYGEHARQLLRAFIECGQFDVSVCGVKWGSTPFLDPTDTQTESINVLIEKYELEKRNGVNYDVSIQVTIPNEFQKLARVNIGVTAGIEVNRVSPRWIQQVNDVVDLLVVPSKHSAETFANTVYKNEQGASLQLKKPILIAPEGFDSSIFNLLREGIEPVVELESEFNFLSVGLGLERGVGEDRKNISTLVKWFCETFSGDKRVGLVLKTSLVNNSLLDFEATKGRILQIKQSTGCGEFPRIQLVHGRLTREQLASLYKDPKIKAYVTLTHGEGFGLPIIEAAACGLPIVATNWSGHIDFLSTPDGKKKFVPLDFELRDIPDSAVWEGVMERGSTWAYPKEEDTKTKLKKVFLSIEKPTEWARELAMFLSQEYEEVKLGKQLVTAIQQFLNDSAGPKQGEIAENLGPAEVRKKMREQLGIPDGSKTLLYTMPMSAGDVFVSSAVVDSLKKKFPEHLIIFGTDVKYGAILKDNPNIFKVIQYEAWMQNVPFCENVFDDVYTPNLAIQLNTSNWVHGGKGRLLGDEIAAQCGVKFGQYFIKTEPVAGLPEKYITFHPGSGKGQWEARNYRHWKKVVKNIKRHTSIPIVQVGLDDDPSFEGCIDLRGKTTYNQLATVIQGAVCVLSIDSVAMHMAAAFRRPQVALFGSSYSSTTGPVLKHEGHDTILIDTPNRMGCEKACYKYQCVVDRESPCVNEIDPKEVVHAVLCNAGTMTESTADRDSLKESWDDCVPKIAGYTHIFNPNSYGFPFVESIKSMLGFCDEVVVVDGGSTDGSLKMIDEIGDPRVKVYTREWDWSEPGMDGMQKAFGRAMVSVGPDDFIWQQDADEVVHEEDYVKIKKIVGRFPSGVDLLHLPVVELWGAPDNVRTDRHSWKWRLSRNNFRVTHGINKDARIFDEKTGRTYAKKGMSDGCEYVDIMTGEHLPHKGFYTKELEMVRQQNPAAYGLAMNKIFKELPSVFHYSWAQLPRKIRNFKGFWNRCWSNLYNDPAPVDRFPSVQTDEDVVKMAKDLLIQGGEHGKSKTFKLERTNPALMESWLGRENVGGPLRDDDASTNTSAEVPAVIAVPQQEPQPVSVDGRP